jgi:prophage DNA circulation protein
MTWRDKLRKASFRGAFFYVRETDTQVGRRNILHQYPDRDEPYLEDLGLDADQFQISGYVIQNQSNELDYFDERDRLITALKQKGSGTLVHPFLGEFQVGLVGKATIRESFQQGGIAVFSMTFVLSGKTEFPSDIHDIEGYIDSIAGEAEATWQESFQAFFNVDGVVDYIYDSGLADLVLFSNDVWNQVSKVVDKASTAAAEILEDLYDIRGAWTNVISQPGQIWEKMEASWDAFTDLFGLTGDLADEEDADDDYKHDISTSALELADWDNEDETISVSTVNRALQYRNRALLVNAIRQKAISTSIKIAVRIEYDSQDAAQEMKDDVVDQIDAQLLKLGDEVDHAAFTDYDEVPYSNDQDYASLQRLRAAFSSAMDELGADLAKVLNYEVPPVVISTLSLAYDQYKDLDRNEEIFDRNKPIASHPGFLPEGQEIEILSR